MSSSSEQFANEVMRQVVTLLCHSTGWDASQKTALDILADIMKRQILHFGKLTHSYSEEFGRTAPSLSDVALAMKDMNISTSELVEYVQHFDPVTLNEGDKVPMFPVRKESKLNFLKPGSDEVLTRPVHVPDYMPPMIFETKVAVPPKIRDEETKDDEAPSTSSPSLVVESVVVTAADKQTPPVVEIEAPKSQERVKEVTPEREVVVENGDGDKIVNGGVIPVPSFRDEDEGMESSEDEIEALNKSPGGSKFVPLSLGKGKRGGVGESPALKRVRKMLEEDGHPVREVTSVIMTTSGFLTSSREGRLPDSRPPPNREFFAPPTPPPVEKKKRPLTMKRIVEGVKKIDKDKEEEAEEGPESDKEEEEELFAKPDKIAKESLQLPKFPPPEKSPKEAPKKVKKLKIDREMAKALSREAVPKDKKSMKLLKKSQAKFGFMDKSKKVKERKLKKLKKHQGFQQFLPMVKEEGDLETVESDEDFSFLQSQQPQEVVPLNLKAIMKNVPGKHVQPFKFARKKGVLGGLVDPMKVKKLKNKTLNIAPNTNILSPARLFPPGGGMTVHPSTSKFSMTSMDDPEMLKKKRGRPRKNPPPTFPGGGVPLSAAALANLGRGLMDDRSRRPLKIKRSHMEMEPDVASLIPEVQLNVPPQGPPSKQKPPRMQQQGHRQQLQETPPQAGYDLLNLPAAPGLIPSSFALPPPPPLKRMPPPLHSPQLPPSIQITPAAKEPKSPFGNVCSSVTITPIEMGGQKLSGRIIPPGIASPPMLKAKPRHLKERSPPGLMQMQMQQMGMNAEQPSGLTITPIMLEQSERYAQEMLDTMYPQDDEEEETYDEEYEHPQHHSRGEKSTIAKLEEEMKSSSKEQRKKDKERRKELKKEKKKEKKDKNKDKDRKEKRDKEKDKDKKKMKKEKSEGLLSPSALAVPKLTLKLSGHSGTPTPVDSPNPPQVLIGEASPPLPHHPKKIIFKPIEEQLPQRPPSPGVARFSALVTRPSPKPGRAAKAQAAAAMAAEAMGNFAQQLFPSTPTGSTKRGSGGGGGGGGSGGGARAKPKADKPDKPKSKGAGKLVTETVGVTFDEQGNKVWICPACGRQDDGSPMIGCDRCDDWYHFVCVGITEEPEEDAQWYCPRCKKKKKDKM